MRKMEIHILLFLAFFVKCDTDFVRSNPFDSAYNPALWMPQKLEIQGNNIHTATLSWIQNEDHIDGFKIDRKTGAGEWVEAYAIVAKSVFSYVDSTIIPGQIIQYRLSAYADQNESDPIQEEIVLDFPPPTNLRIISQDLSQIQLAWNESIEGEEGFIIGKKIGDGELVPSYAVLAENTTGFTDGEIIPGEILSYVVYAFYKNYFSDYSSTSTNINLNAPAKFMIEQLFDDEIRLSWEDSNVGEEGYFVEARYDQGEFTEIQRLGPNVTELKISNIHKNVLYTFRVAAFVGEFVSGYSEEDSIFIEQIIEGPLVFYPFNGNADDEGNNNGNDGVVRGAELDDDRFDNPDASYYFNGINNYIDFGILNSEKISLSIWFKLNEYKNLQPCVLSKNKTNSQDGSFLLEIRQETGNIRFLLRNEGQLVELASTSPVYANLWHHVVVTYNGSELILFLDGEMEDVKNTGFTKINELHEKLLIGKNGNDNFHFCGNIDDIRIFNYAIDNVDVKNLFHENGWEGNNPQEENMVFVEGGAFQMGDIWGDGYSNETPVHDVTLNTFYISKYETDLSEFLTFLNDVGVSGDGVLNGNILIEMNASTPIQYNGSEYVFVNNAGAVAPDCPAIFCTWYGAVEYCNWMSTKNGYNKAYTVTQGSVVCNWSANGYRLPTEAEWEYAGRSGGNDQSKWSGNPDLLQAKYYMWYLDNSEDQVHPVGTRKGNSLGLFDLSGNVWEWCWDWYGNYNAEAQNNPTGVLTGSARVVRGGSFSNKIMACRTISRGTGLPTKAYNNIGFRICRNQ
ncbi:MAG: SUMF1/EgtB/PvdO family nonheme iron enzyme [Candidatus Marinimicrobia bacterium]|nr:SUMF1/EgtB/PvdO family nonheme iron enzyme [Candidatus Neomarinimicrobiota bacterium]